MMMQYSVEMFGAAIYASSIFFFSTPFLHLNPIYFWCSHTLEFDEENIWTVLKANQI